MTTNWKNLLNNPPTEGCNICIKVGDDYQTYKFTYFSDGYWEACKLGRTYDSHNFPSNAVYINLDEIKN